MAYQIAPDFRLSKEHFGVDGTPIEALASLNSYRPTRWRWPAR